MYAPMRIPALQALLIQFVALLLVASLAWLLPRVSTLGFGLWGASLLQAVCAAVMSAMSGMRRWWIAIHLLFAPGALFFTTFDVPPWIFLALFVLSSALYWQTFRTQVPYYPSARAIRGAVAALLPEQGGHFIDIGSGFGGLVLDLARQRPGWRCSGIELAPLPWAISSVRARLCASRARFLRGDYEALDFSQFDVVFAYLSPAAMPALWRHAKAQMRPGTLLLSYEFPIPGVAPSFAVSPAPGLPPLFGWRF